MTRSALFSVLSSEFDDFLFASIGNDRNDMPLSVLSALARLDVDPWVEAAELARLPRETATQRLASSIASVPYGPSAYLEHGTIAARLITLLPRQANSNIPSPGNLLDATDVTKFRAGMGMFVVFIVFIYIAQWLTANRQTSTPVNTTYAPASGIVSQEAPQPYPGQ